MLIITITIMRTPRRESEQKIVRMTRQRRAILDALERSRSHPTANQVYQSVRRRLSHISLATVYRNLGLLACGRSEGQFVGFVRLAGTPDQSLPD